MAGPCSLPEGPKARWEELNEIVCNEHFHCDMRAVDKKGHPVKHNYLTLRMWLSQRNRLRTGKTL